MALGWETDTQKVTSTLEVNFWQSSPLVRGESQFPCWKRTFLSCSYLVPKSCPTLWEPMDCSLPGSSVHVHRTTQARMLEWVALSFSRGSSWARDWTCISCIDRQILHHWAFREAHISVLLLRNIVVVDDGHEDWGWRKKRKLNNARSQSITSPNALSGLRSGSSVSLSETSFSLLHTPLFSNPSQLPKDH